MLIRWEISAIIFELKDAERGGAKIYRRNPLNPCRLYNNSAVGNCFEIRQTLEISIIFSGISLLKIIVSGDFLAQYSIEYFIQIRRVSRRRTAWVYFCRVPFSHQILTMRYHLLLEFFKKFFICYEKYTFVNRRKIILNNSDKPEKSSGHLTNNWTNSTSKDVVTFSLRQT